jgi:hypothetical protein
VKSGHAGDMGKLRPFGVSSVAPSGMLLWNGALDGSVPSGEADPALRVVVCAKTPAQPRSSITTAADINIPDSRIESPFLFRNLFIVSLSSQHRAGVSTAKVQTQRPVHLCYNRAALPAFHLIVAADAKFTRGATSPSACQNTCRQGCGELCGRLGRSAMRTRRSCAASLGGEAPGVAASITDHEPAAPQLSGDCVCKFNF